MRLGRSPTSGRSAPRASTSCTASAALRRAGSSSACWALQVLPSAAGGSGEGERWCSVLRPAHSAALDPFAPSAFHTSARPSRLPPPFPLAPRFRKDHPAGHPVQVNRGTGQAQCDRGQRAAGWAAAGLVHQAQGDARICTYNVARNMYSTIRLQELDPAGILASCDWLFGLGNRSAGALFLLRIAAAVPLHDSASPLAPRLPRVPFSPLLPSLPPPPHNCRLHMLPRTTPCWPR